MKKTECSQILLVDNSNTRTKFALFREGKVEPVFASLPTAELSVESIRAMLDEHHWHSGKTLICSVVPAAAAIIAEAVGGCVRMLDAHTPMNIVLDYPGVATLGADRIANAMGAASLVSLPCVVIDFGTAVTFDVLVASEQDARPRFIGGVIAPGLAAMGQYLGRNTALLPALAPEKPQQAIGRSTAEALHAGSFYGYCGLVRGILQGIQEELGEPPHIVATGGDASLMREWMPEISELCPELTFRGLVVAAELAREASFF